MTYTPNINLQDMPDGMTIAQGAEILRSKREDERRGLIFSVGIALMSSKEASTMLTTPATIATEVGDYVDQLQRVAYTEGLPTAVDPTQQLAVEIGEEAAKDWNKASKEPDMTF
jgi:hypothetical protein